MYMTMFYKMNVSNFNGNWPGVCALYISIASPACVTRVSVTSILTGVTSLVSTAANNEILNEISFIS